MSIIEKISGEHVDLLIADKFIFADGSNFRKLLMGIVEKKIKSLDVDLKDLAFMDSSGLGMSMVAQKECEAQNIALRILHPKDGVKLLLEMTKSYERFKIID